LVPLAVVRGRNHVGSDRGIRGEGLHVRGALGNREGALTLRINTSRRERTRRHNKTQNRARRRQQRWTFTIPLRFGRGNPEVTLPRAFWGSVWGVHQCMSRGKTSR